MMNLRRKRSAIVLLSLLALVWAAAQPLFAARLEPADGPAVSAELIPGAVELNRKGQVHQLLVEEKTGDNWTGDLTSRATFRSSNPEVATIDENGQVRAAGDGEATITAEIEGRALTAKITVRGADEQDPWSFANQIQPVLTKMGCNAGACHGAAAGKNGLKLSLRGFDSQWDYNMLTRKAGARRVSLVEPEQSLMLLKPTMDIPHEGGERFEKDSETYRLLLAWIEDGAPPPNPNDPTVTHLEVIPRRIQLGSGAEQQIIVRAHYTGGAARDVTRWVKFGTTDDGVAEVDEAGKITVKGPGAVAITVWFASKVASARVLAPRAKPVPAEVYARAERRNFIDGLVLKQLENLRIEPAGGISDIEFIRRASLDATGVLPDRERVFKFSMENNPRKREKLIDELLESEEFIDYWAYKWSDLLLLSSKKLGQRDELNAFYRFIRDSVKVNKPWDQFVTEIITARGLTTENGAVNYFAMHQETIDLTETTSKAFMGMSITCARCHNHPLEKWTQDDYYGMANLLARVKIKRAAGSRTEVLPGSFGNIIHPRLGRPVAPKPLEAEPIALDAPGDRRVYLARWLTSPDNPYFTRAIVNRVWRNFMGRGLVEPEDDLRLTNPASNDELLTALADDLANHGYDLKYLIRTMMNSATYQRSSQSADPDFEDDKYYSQYIIRRLGAEVILDAYSRVTGVPTRFEGYPEGFRALQLPDSRVGSYFLTAFGRPERIQTCACERTEATSIAQALHEYNGDTLNEKLSHKQSILTEMIEDNVGDEDALEQIYLRALSRFPNQTERKEALAVLAGVPREGEGWMKQRREALEDLTWAVLTGKEFLFNH